MTAPAPIHGGPMTELRPGLWSEQTGGGVILHGEPHVLSRICAALGFRNRCERGRVALHAGNTAKLPKALEAAHV